MSEDALVDLQSGFKASDRCRFEFQAADDVVAIDRAPDGVSHPATTPVVNVEHFAAVRLDGVGEVFWTGIRATSFLDGEVVNDRQFIFPHGSSDQGDGFARGASRTPGTNIQRTGGHQLGLGAGSQTNEPHELLSEGASELLGGVRGAVGS